LARETKTVSPPVGFVSGADVTTNCTTEKTPGDPKELVRDEEVTCGVFGQCSVTCETAGWPRSRIPDPVCIRKKHLCLPCERQQAGSDASAALEAAKTTRHGATDSSSRNKALRRLIPSQRICGFTSTESISSAWFNATRVKLSFQPNRHICRKKEGAPKRWPQRTSATSRRKTRQSIETLEALPVSRFEPGVRVFDGSDRMR
jgi:hypothetical protein